MNDVFLMKMLWNLITKPDDLWCKVSGKLFSRILCGSWATETISISGWINGPQVELLFSMLLQVLAIPAPMDIDEQDTLGWGGTNTIGTSQLKVPVIFRTLELNLSREIGRPCGVGNALIEFKHLCG
ncbi:hypothetical protein A2U01_0015973 [Trifolium medium]|uniref:Uncharacterized protein n=1 Tax=Trifolium medium TaxID=97028 RepID=A0A392N5I3_9FABA|nr:hypothetical protein [Trifolium medium]